MLQTKPSVMWRLQSCRGGRWQTAGSAASDFFEILDLIGVIAPWGGNLRVSSAVQRRCVRFAWCIKRPVLATFGLATAGLLMLTPLRSRLTLNHACSPKHPGL